MIDNPSTSDLQAEPNGKTEERRSRWRQWFFPELKNAGWRTKLRWLVVRLVFWYAVIVSMFALLQRKLIYLPTRTGRLPASKSRLPDGAVHDIAVTTHDDLTLHGWHFLAQGVSLHGEDALDRHLQQTSWLVLYFHGNGGNRENRQELCSIFTANGADVFLFDYRGYAENPGSPNEEAFLADAQIIWNYATQERKVPPSRIILYGESLGGGVAVPLAARTCRAGESPGGVILWGAFSSLTDVGSNHYPWLPVRWLLRDRYDSLGHAPEVTCPVLQIHGEADRIVPLQFGRRLCKSFPEQSENGMPKTWVTLPGVGHNDLPLDALRRQVERFWKSLQKHGGRDGKQPE